METSRMCVLLYTAAVGRVSAATWTALSPKVARAPAAGVVTFTVGAVVRTAVAVVHRHFSVNPLGPDRWWPARGETGTNYNLLM